MVEVTDLRKSYGDLQAVRGVSFRIPAGTIFGLLGPNGAGKTSIIEMIEGLRVPDGGSIRVCGLDPIRQERQVKEIIGAQLQITSLPDKIKVIEVLDLFATFYSSPRNMDDVLDLVGLRHKREAFFEKMSGGEKQRVALALALVNDPRVIFLDEPTTGLDAQIRRELHDLILRIKGEGKAILLTTHYIEEAEKLCDLVGIINQGQLHAIGSPRQLIQEQGEGDRLEVRLRAPMDVAALAALEGVMQVRPMDGLYIFRGPSAGKMLASVAVYADRNQNEVVEARVAHTSLEDVYLQMTGKRISE